MINWPTVCLPKQFGGMGVLNLELQNTALLLRWWWRLYTQRESLWYLIVSKIRKRTGAGQIGNFWLCSGSFFWASLQKMKFIFHWGCLCIIGNGKTVSFWFDARGGRPLRGFHGDKEIPMLPKLSLRDARNRLGELNVSAECMDGIVFLENEEDSFYWKFTADGNYTTKSTYMALVGGGKISWEHSHIWNIRAPQTVRIFCYLLLKKQNTHKGEPQIKGNASGYKMFDVQ